jgi:AcrR family transcriptional regulator
MTSAVPTETLRERKRRAVQAELVAVAQELFVQNGYESTTVEQIAAGVGISVRTFFRYFPSKEALVLGKYEQLGDELSGRFCSRSTRESVWVSLRRMFDYVIEYAAKDRSSERMREIDRIVNGTDSLRAAYLERMERVQARIAELVAARLSEDGTSRQDRDAAATAIVAAAFACMTAASKRATATDIPLDTALDEAMRAVSSASAGIMLTSLY